MSYCPSILYMDQWFIKKTGLAFGIMWVSEIWNTRIGAKDTNISLIVGWHWAWWLGDSIRYGLGPQSFRLSVGTARLVIGLGTSSSAATSC